MVDNVAELISKASQSLDWLTFHINEFAPCRDGQIDEFGLKAFSELAFAYVYLREWRHQFGVAEKHLPVWRSFLHRFCENPEFAQFPRKSSATAFAYVFPYLMLRATGYRSSFYEETLQLLRRRDCLRNVELVPYRVLDREHSLWKSGFLKDEPNWHALFKATALGSPHGPLNFDDEATYSVTHTLFYVTDLGNRHLILALTQRRKIIELVECLLIHYWRRQNWDLVGELLINLNCLGVRKSGAYEEAARAYHGAWRIDGTVPPKRARVGATQKQSERKGFRWCYHPTLVAVLYCGTAIHAITDRS
jgi:hypothetical protein